MDNYVELKNVSFRRDGRLIFDDISLNIPKGKVTSILGPSGTGKTTLLGLITGQLKPDSGQIRVNDLSVPDLSRQALFEQRKKMSLLFQSGALFTDISVFENVAFALREHTQLPQHMIRDLVLLRLENVGLRGAGQLMPSQLSGGMARRVALARSIILDPELIMYDEPFTGQDPVSKGVLVKLIRGLNRDLALTSVLVSHDVEEALSISDQVYVLGHGQVIASGSPQSLRDSNNSELKQFLFGLPDGPVSFHFPAKPLIQEVLA
jgi:phospholipid/cholesterol/gamma-HCH transport system ATP-binding protein